MSLSRTGTILDTLPEEIHAKIVEFLLPVDKLQLSYLGDYWNRLVFHNCNMLAFLGNGVNTDISTALIQSTLSKYTVFPASNWCDVFDCIRRVGKATSIDCLYLAEISGFVGETDDDFSTLGDVSNCLTFLSSFTLRNCSLEAQVFEEIISETSLVTSVSILHITDMSAEHRLMNDYTQCVKNLINKNQFLKNLIIIDFCNQYDRVKIWNRAKRLENFQFNHFNPSCIKEFCNALTQCTDGMPSFKDDEASHEFLNETTKEIQENARNEAIKKVDVTHETKNEAKESNVDANETRSRIRRHVFENRSEKNSHDRNRSKQEHPCLFKRSPLTRSLQRLALYPVIRGLPRNLTFYNLTDLRLYGIDSMYVQLLGGEKEFPQLRALTIHSLGVTCPIEQYLCVFKQNVNLRVLNVDANFKRETTYLQLSRRYQHLEYIVIRFEHLVSQQALEAIASMKNLKYIVWIDYLNGYSKNITSRIDRQLAYLIKSLLKLRVIHALYLDISYIPVTHIALIEKCSSTTDDCFFIDVSGLEYLQTTVNLFSVRDKRICGYFSLWSSANNTHGFFDYEQLSMAYLQSIYQP